MKSTIANHVAATVVILSGAKNLKSVRSFATLRMTSQRYGFAGFCGGFSVTGGDFVIRPCITPP